MFLFKVENIYDVTSVGLVLTPGPGDKIKYVKIGTSLNLILPDKSTIKAVVTTISFQDDHPLGISIAKNEMVPAGTEVWLNDK